MPKIDEKLHNVTARLAEAVQASGRSRTDVALVAVSKTQPATALIEAYHAGQRRFGENYLQEALDKQESLASLPDIEWHFIGPVQSNKTRAIAERFAWVHSVDREKIARRLSEQRPDSHPPLQVCLQVNLDAEQSKSGVTPEALPTLARAVAGLPNLTLRGLMAIPSPRDNAREQRAVFARLRQALADLNDLALLSAQGEPLVLDTLSMGMSADLEAAVAEGATLVRVGTDIFGARHP